MKNVPVATIEVAEMSILFLKILLSPRVKSYDHSINVLVYFGLFLVKRFLYSAQWSKVNIVIPSFSQHTLYNKVFCLYYDILPSFVLR